MLDLALLEKLEGQRRVVMIASGGCTAASLVASGLVSRLCLVDLNPAQIGLTRLKLLLLRQADVGQRMALLGHAKAAAAQRLKEGLNWMRSLELPEEMFGDPAVWSERGLDYCGRYEVVFAELQRQLDGGPLNRENLEEALRDVMSQENLAALFGPAATSNRRREFWQHFLEQTETALALDPTMEGPFLSQMLKGRFQGALHHWLPLEPPSSWPEVEFQLEPMSEALFQMEDNSCDYLHLSNILDWLPEDDARWTLSRAAAVLRPGGLVAVRQLNSTLPVRELGRELEWQDELSSQLLASDRSFFYRELHVGMKSWF